MRWEGGVYVAPTWEKKNGHRFLTGKPEGNITLERTMRKLQCKFKMDLKIIGWENALN
jgi:hypothetical protein